VSCVKSRPWRHVAAALLLGLAAAGPARAAGLADSLERPAARVSRPAQAVLLGLAVAGQRLVAVGERGLIVLSDDAGASWRQVATPLSATLTAVRFPTPTHGWAVGHRGVILHTTDGGERWTVQLEGRAFADRALADAQARGDAAALAEARRLQRDGADKPFLDISFDDAERGIAVGAYNLCARTDDGGRHWQPCMGQLGNPQAAHLYAVARAGDHVFIAGEQGLLLRGAGHDGRFTAVPLAYAGSLFCIGAAPNGDVVVGGLRGHAFVSTDRGRSFTALPGATAASFSAATHAPSTSLLLATQLGDVLAYDGARRRLVPLPTPPLPSLTGMAAHPSGAWVLTSDRGIATLPAMAHAPGARP